MPPVPPSLHPSYTLHPCTVTHLPRSSFHLFKRREEGRLRRPPAAIAIATIGSIRSYELQSPPTLSPSPLKQCTSSQDAGEAIVLCLAYHSLAQHSKVDTRIPGKVWTPQPAVCGKVPRPPPGHRMRHLATWQADCSLSFDLPSPCSVMI